SAIRSRAGAHSFEGKVFNVVSSACVDQSLFEALRTLEPAAHAILELSPGGVSLVIGPSGDVISNTLCDSEGLLYQDIGISQCVEPKQFHEIVGYYNRFDVFELKINRARLAPIQFEDETLLQPAAPADATGESV